jgi:hypothetical protein
MLANVLKSPRAVQASIQVVRAFVRLREILSTHKDLARKLAELESKYDAQFKVVFDAIRELMTPPKPKKRSIGFLAPTKNSLAFYVFFLMSKYDAVKTLRLVKCRKQRHCDACGGTIEKGTEYLRESIGLIAKPTGLRLRGFCLRCRTPNGGDTAA